MSRSVPDSSPPAHERSRGAVGLLAVFLAVLLGSVAAALLPAGAVTTGPFARALQRSAAGDASSDWPQWGGSPSRNNTPSAANVPTDWDVGGFDRKTGRWLREKARNIKWVARLGSQSYMGPVVAGGRVFIGTNNGAGYLARYPKKVDLGCLLCFRASDGRFLWQHSSEKLASGDSHDWAGQGICCAPLVEGDRLWFVTNRGEVVCLDTEGFYDGGENDGPYRDEKETDPREADIVWVYDFMKEQGVSQHNMCSCSVTALGNILFVCTSNGVDDSHEKVPAPEAASFMALDKRTGEVLWTDNSPGANILHGQWASPAAGVLGGVAQVIFPGGDGYLYSFRADRSSGGKGKLLWKFDCNPKQSEWKGNGRGDRNSIVATPVIYDGLVYIATGQDPENGDGIGDLWCIDPTRRGDVSAELAVKAGDRTTPIPRRRTQAVIVEKGEAAVANPNSAAVWHYRQRDENGDGKFDFEEQMHRALGMVAVKNDLLFIADHAGLVHCLDAKTGKVHWTYDMMATVWGSPMIAAGRVYIGNEDGDVYVFKLSAQAHEPLATVSMDDSIYSAPIMAGGVMYLATRTHLFAIPAPAEQ